jgi:hypothetical protein
VSTQIYMVRDRPFNLKGGGYGCLLRSEFLFLDNTRVRIFFFGRAKREFFFQNLTLGYMTKTLNQIICFFLHQNQNIFFSNIGNQNIFLEKPHGLRDQIHICTRLAIIDWRFLFQIPINQNLAEADVKFELVKFC